MTSPDDSSRAAIIQQLSNGVNRNDIILELCHKQGIDWDEGEAWVRDVELYDEDHITRRQSPILLFLSLGVTLGGAALAAAAAYYLLDFLQMQRAEQLAYAPDLYGVGVMLVLGIAMLAGGLAGFRRVLGAFLN